MSELLKIISINTGLSISDILRVASNGPNRYKVFMIEKRSGGLRKIAQPARELKHIQRSLIKILEKNLPVHESATAYRIGKSICDNASPHLSSTHLLKLDFKDFFGSILEQDFSKLCVPLLGWKEQTDIALLVGLLFWRDKERSGLRLSIGAPSSPFLSNAMLFSFDASVAAYCATKEITYTRYADDMTFSCLSNERLHEVLIHLTRMLQAMSHPRLTLNDQKTTFVSKRFGRRVTGLTLTNEGRLSIGHEKKRQLRAAIHRFSLGKLDHDQAETLRGNLAFTQSVEASFLSSMKNKYGNEVIEQLLRRKVSRDPFWESLKRNRIPAPKV